MCGLDYFWGNKIEERTIKLTELSYKIDNNCCTVDEKRFFLFSYIEADIDNGDRQASILGRWKTTSTTVQRDENRWTDKSYLCSWWRGYGICDDSPLSQAGPLFVFIFEFSFGSRSVQGVDTKSGARTQKYSHLTNLALSKIITFKRVDQKKKKKSFLLL